MNDNPGMTPEMPKPGEGERRANVSAYLDRPSSTILMLIKLAEALGKLCLAILGGCMLQAVVSALNRLFAGSTVSDGKAMVAQTLKTLRVPMATIKEIVDAIPADLHFSSAPVTGLFVVCLPFVLIAILEAIAAIRLRFGKGGTRMIGILQRIYYILDAIRLALFALTGIGLSLYTIFRMGGPASIMLSTVYVSLAVFFILIGLPTLLYHRNIAKYMDDVGYEMKTGLQAPRKRRFFKQTLTILIVLEVIGAVVSVIASRGSLKGSYAIVMLLSILFSPIVKLVRYICMTCCYRNYMHAESAPATDGSVSHVPQVILILLVILIFAVPTGLLCSKSNDFSTAIVESVEEYVGNARETVNDLNVAAEQQIEVVQSAAEEQIGAVQSAAGEQLKAAQSALGVTEKTPE